MRRGVRHRNGLKQWSGVVVANFNTALRENSRKLPIGGDLSVLSFLGHPAPDWDPEAMNLRWPVW